MKSLINKGILFLLVSSFFWGCSTTRYHKLKETRKIIDAAFRDSLFAHAHWGILIESLDSRKILYEHNAAKMFIPASNQKIITSAAALKTLSPDFQFETKLYYSGEIIDSVLIEDLIIQGNGDPTFSSEFNDDPRLPFYCWADTLLNLGIYKIAGNIVGDDNAFDDVAIGTGWMNDDLIHSYAAETGALQFNDNSIKIRIIPPVNLNGSFKIIPEIESNYFSILSNTIITESGSSNLKISRSLSSNAITVSGSVPAGVNTLKRSISISNPTLYFVTVFAEILRKKGIEITGSILDCDDLKNWKIEEENVKLITIQRSPPLSIILQSMMKESINLYAETLLKTMGRQEAGIGSFEEGKEVVKQFLFDSGIEPGTYAYHDGSGLSRYNLLSPEQIVQVLKRMRNDENWEIWKEFFPIAGVDGTLEYRMAGTQGVGNVRAKTGTMSNVRCLSGYLKTESGEEIVFSILVNGHLRKSKEIDFISDHILNVIIEKTDRK